MLHRLGIVICLIGLAACSQQAQQGKSGVTNSPVVARVGNVALHESDIDAEMAKLPEALQHLQSDPEARRRVLQTLIQRQVLSQKAQEVGLDTNPEIHQRIERTRNSILIQALEQWQMSRLPQPTDQQIEAYYRLHVDEFTTPAQIHARHILLPTEKQAKEVMAKLKRPDADFAALAAQYSIDDSNKTRGGDLNWFARGTMVKPFEKAAFALKKPGDLAGPVKTQFGWHIIQLLDSRPASVKSLADAKEEIIGQLMHQQLESWIDKTVADSSVDIVDPAYREPAGLDLPKN